MSKQNKIGLAIIFISIFILLSSYLFTTPDSNARTWQKISLLYKTAYNPRLSELVLSDYHWSLYGESSEILIKIVHYPTFYNLTIRYSYLATICLLFFFIGLYMFMMPRNKNEK